jgi:hypothetical protein
VASASPYESPAASYRESGGLSPSATLALGAVTGLAVGYLFFTDHGRRLLERVEPVVDTWLRELSRLRDTADKARLVYTEGRDSLTGMTRIGGNAGRQVQERS